MGFFSSRKAEPTPLPASEVSSVKVIRSRFYGKSKSSSGRSSIPPTPPLLHVPREATTFNQSPYSPGRHVSANALTMSLAQRLNELAVANADNLLNDEEYRLLRQNLFERFSAGSDIPTEAPVVPISPVSTMSPVASTRTNPSASVLRRPSIDSQRSIATTVSSLFRRATGRTSSLTSPALSTSGSMGGSVFSLQQQQMPQGNETSSVYSRPSFSSGAPPSAVNMRGISRQPSDDSLMSTSQAGSTSGSVTNDLRGVMNRNRRFGGNSVHYASSISSRATTRSAKPPSSFHLRQPTSSPQILPRTHEDDDDDRPKSAAELREEIENVESEGRKLLDAFNGLELTALTKSRAVGPMNAPLEGTINARRLTAYPDSTSLSISGSSFTLVPERSLSMRKQTNGQTHSIPLVSQPVNLKRKPSVVNSITGSFKSSTMSTIPSSLHSSRSSPNLVSSTPPPPPPMPALPIAASSPSAALHKKRPSIMRQRQPTQTTQTTQTHNVSRGLHTVSPVPVLRPSLSPQSKSTRPSVTMDPALHALEVELADIRRRKADVSQRYEHRLDFLRAKLKSAEIRERLSKK